MAQLTRNYLYGIVNEEQRNLLQHEVLKPKTRELMVSMLEDYGLKERLLAARDTGTRVQILEAGCGDGYFLQDFADLLAEQSLLSSAELTGVDINEAGLLLADARRKTKPTWEPINYLKVDITHPFEQDFSLRTMKKVQFDCICETLVLQYLPNAREVLQNLYDHLKPGGIIYLCESNMTYDGEDCWIAPNEGFAKFGRIATKLVRDMNGGQVVAREVAGWLEEMGAEKVEAVTNLLKPAGGDSASIDILRYYISVVRSVTPVLLNFRLITQAEQEEILSSVFKVSKESTAQLPFIHTVARKPE